MVQQITEEIFQYVIHENEFFVHYQPIVSIGKGKMIGMESLLRTSYKGERISPEMLFSYTTDVEMLFDLDMLCHKHALKEYVKEKSDKILFLNFETRILKQYIQNFEQLVQSIDMFRIERSNIVIEINEKNADREELLPEISKLCKNAGFLVALDDVGTGHSNFKRIIQVEPDIIKIDRSVIMDIDKSYHKQEILRAVCKLGQKIGAITIAEGVEKEEEIITGLLCGVDWYQGFHFDRAMLPELIKTKSYREKCNVIAHSYQKEVISRMKRKATIMDEQKNIFQSLVQDLTSSMNIDIERILSVYLKKTPSLECIYILDENGIQTTDTVFNRNIKIKNEKMFSPTQSGDYHISKQYYYYVITNTDKIYISSKYVSQATGNLCRTISSLFVNKEGKKIVCVDFSAEKNRE